MQIGYIGLGKMGLGMVRRLTRRGYAVRAFDPKPGARAAARKLGAAVFVSAREAVEGLQPPRVVWLMVPHGAVGGALREIGRSLERGDTLIDGGNSFYAESMRRRAAFKKRGIAYLDAGVSGGPAGAKAGACIMVGGDERTYAKLFPLFRALSAKGGFVYAGGSGAGHFAKMVHNGIEYGMMQAIAEGFELLSRAHFDFSLKDIASVYNHGSVIESRLMGWLAGAYRKHGVLLKGVSPVVGHTGAGAWTVAAAKKLRVPVPVIAAAVRFRKASARDKRYAGRVLTGLRGEFGGHAVREKKP